jgi:hypothetical protein
MGETKKRIARCLQRLSGYLCFYSVSHLVFVRNVVTDYLYHVKGYAIGAGFARWWAKV